MPAFDLEATVLLQRKDVLVNQLTPSLPPKATYTEDDSPISPAPSAHSAYRPILQEATS